MPYIYIYESLIQYDYDSIHFYYRLCQIAWMFNENNVMAALLKQSKPFNKNSVDFFFVYFEIRKKTKQIYLINEDNMIV